MNNEIFLSFIIPAYNSEKYIESCINSILKLKKMNIEIIIIDDGSTDNTLNVCNKYNKYNYLHIISIRNQGVSNARNIGIENACGKFITFVDSDDALIPSEYLKMFNLLVEKYYDYDIIEFSYQLIDGDGIKISQIIFNEQSLSSNQLLQQSLKNINTKDFCWNKIYSSKLIKSVKFQNFKCSEDYLFNIECCLKSAKKKILPLVCYNYRQHGGSVGHERFNDKKLDVVRAREYVYNNLPLNSSYKKIVKVSILDRTYYLLKEAKYISSTRNLLYLKNIYIKYFSFRTNFLYYTGRLYNRSIRRFILFLILTLNFKKERKIDF